jgi:hypothetical protein
VSRSSKKSRNKQKKPPKTNKPQPRPESGWRWWIILGVTLALALPGLYWDWKPKMAMEIQQRDPNPFNAEIIVKNDGRFCMRGVEWALFVSQGIKNNLVVPKSPDSKYGIVTDNIFRTPTGFLGEVCPGQSRTFTLPFNEKALQYSTDMHICFTIFFQAWPFGKQRFKSGFYFGDGTGSKWVPRACPDDEKKV